MSSPIDYNAIFRRAAEQAFSDFPELAAHTIFLLHNRQEPTVMVMHPEADLKTAIVSSGFQQAFNRCLCEALRSPQYGFQHLSISVRQIEGLFLEPHRGFLYTFYHEIAHLLCPDGLPGDKGYVEIVSENIQDAYATLRVLQSLNDATSHAVSRTWSLNRGIDAFLGSHWDHVSTTTIDAILKDAADNRFSSLTPAQTLECAREYALKYGPSEDDISDAHSTWLRGPPSWDRAREGSVADRVRFIQDFCLKAENPFTRVIGVRILPVIFAFPHLRSSSHFEGVDIERNPEYRLFKSIAEGGCAGPVSPMQPAAPSLMAATPPAP